MFYLVSENANGSVVSIARYVEIFDARVNYRIYYMYNISYNNNRELMISHDLCAVIIIDDIIFSRQFW